MDLAAVRFVNVATNVTNITVLGVSANCYRCVAQPVVTLNATYRASSYLALDTNFAISFDLMETNPHNVSFHFAEYTREERGMSYHYSEEALRNLIELHHATHDEDGKPLLEANVLASFDHHFGEHGVYTVIIRDPETNENGTGLLVEVQATHEPDDPNIPIYVAIGVIVGLAIIWQAITWGYRFGLIAWEHHKLKQDGADGLEAMYGTGQVLFTIVHP